MEATDNSCFIRIKNETDVTFTEIILTKEKKNYIYGGIKPNETTCYKACGDSLSCLALDFITLNNKTSSGYSLSYICNSSHNSHGRFIVLIKQNTAKILHEK